MLVHRHPVDMATLKSKDKSSLERLPIECINEIVIGLPTRSDRSRLCQVSRTLCDLILPNLYRDVQLDDLNRAALLEDVLVLPNASPSRALFEHTVSLSLERLAVGTMQTLLAACGPSLRKLTIESSIIDEQDHLDLARCVKDLPLQEINLVRTWPSTFRAWTCGPVALETFHVRQVEGSELDIESVNTKSDDNAVALTSLSARDIRCSKAWTLLHQLAELTLPSLVNFGLSDIDFWPRPTGGFSKCAWPSLKSLRLSSYTSTSIISIMEQTPVLETFKWHCEPNAVGSDLQSSMAALASIPGTVQNLSIFGLQPVKLELAEAAISLLGRLHDLKRLGALTWAYDKAAAPETDENEEYDSDAEVGPSPFPELRDALALELEKRGLPSPRSEDEERDLLFTWIPEW